MDSFLKEWNNGSPYVEVQTSGSTGVPKRMKVEKRRMLNSARITCDFLGLKQGDTALLCMSTAYIAGKMMVVRAIERGLQLISVEPSGHPLKTTQEGLPPCIDFAAMVPLQVYNSLQVPEERERLRNIRHLIIGGGAIDAQLEEALKDFPHAVWSTYGMTETLSHIALRRLNGPMASQWYVPFDGVTLSASEDGCLVIDAPAVHDGLLVTNDMVELRDDGSFRVLGRKDNVVCSGGIKIQMEEVERLLQPHLSIPYMITRAKDERLGEAVALLMEGDSADEVKQVCERVLPRYWQPRRFVVVDRLPLTETGKPARAEAERIVHENGTHPHG